MLKITKADNAVASFKHKFEDNATLSDLSSVIEHKWQLSELEIDLLSGFPPSVITGQAETLLKDLGLGQGSLVIVRPNAERVSILNKLVEVGFSREVCCQALKLVPSDDIELLVEVCRQIVETSAVGQIPDKAITCTTSVIRKIIDADNSCLFNAIGYLVTKGRSDFSPDSYRSIVAQTILNNADGLYTEEFLGKDPKEYAAWIMDSSKWGGEIELSILSTQLGIEIAAIDISTGLVLVYGEGCDYPERVYVIYDGVHYDAIVQKRITRAADPASVTPLEEVTAFSPTDSSILEEARNLANELKSQKKFVNLSGGELQCKVCFAVLTGQKAAVEHAKATGHQNFGQVEN